MAREFGFANATEFALVVESWTQEQRRNCLEEFYHRREARLADMATTDEESCKEEKTEDGDIKMAIKGETTEDGDMKMDIKEEPSDTNNIDDKVELKREGDQEMAEAKIKTEETPETKFSSIFLYDDDDDDEL